MCNKNYVNIAVLMLLFSQIMLVHSKIIHINIYIIQYSGMF